MAPVVALFAFVVVAPVVLVGLSPRVGGHRKVRWMLVTTLLSWLGYFLFLAVTRHPDAPTSLEA